MVDIHAKFQVHTYYIRKVNVGSPSPQHFRAPKKKKRKVLVANKLNKNKNYFLPLQLCILHYTTYISRDLL